MFVRPATRAIFLALLACLLVALAAPAVAAAATEFTVDSTFDERDEDLNDGICKAAVFGTCTLRAALEEVNEQEDSENTIKFDSTVFEGEESDAIFVASLLGALPAIEFPTTIEAGSNCTADGVVGAPCAGVIGLTGEPVFAVKADDTKISGLSITSGSVNIGVYDESTGFEATGNWIGIFLNGSNALPASATGILLEPGSDKATIGGSLDGDRNVIAFNDVGLDIKGASETTVRGNFFGVTGDGETPGPQKANIRVTDSKSPDPVDKAEDNEIGTVLSEAAQKSAKCDGGCNVISGADEGVVLYGANPLDVPASGPTTIHGNYIGLDYAGDKAVKVDEGIGGFEGNRSTGVSAGTADEVTVGGDPKSEANYIVGGSTGVATEDSDGFEARGNVFGHNAGGADATPQSTRAVFAFNSGTAVIADNRIRMGEGGNAIEHSYIGATIKGNTIEGGEFGISSTETGTPAGSLIEDNVIEGTEDSGIFLANPGNKVFGNEIVGAGGSGIELEAETDEVKGNVIGGDSDATENSIFDSDGFAIMIRGTEGSRNEIGRNHGSGNEGEGPFIVFRTIDTVPNEKDPNGAKPPIIVSAGKAEATGKGALPGALVRIFFKASEEEGELGGYLGKGKADGSGNWKVVYDAPAPGETLVTATQTNTEGGTSQLADIVKTPPDPPPATCATDPALCPPKSNPPGPTPPAPTKPKVTIAKGPKPKSTSTTATFKFSSNEAGSSFSCKLDGKAFAKCRSPKTYKKLKPGKHTFKVKAVSPVGLVSAVLTRKFEVLK